MSTSRITSRPGVCGGDACVDGTRVPVWVIMAVIRQAYPQLSYDDICAAAQYAVMHPDEIEQAEDDDE